MANEKVDSDEKQRQLIVAMAVTRGYGLFEIAEQLDKKGLPADEETIKADILALSVEWEQRAGQSSTQHLVAMLAEIREVKRTAWAMNDLVTVLKALQQEYGLLSQAQKQSGPLDFTIHLASDSDPGNDRMLEISRRAHNGLARRHTADETEAGTP
jgi:hypothetical protein